MSFFRAGVLSKSASEDAAAGCNHDSLPTNTNSICQGRMPNACLKLLAEGEMELEREKTTADSMDK